tara:strand:+ start:1225 stop:1524 length:300 start_codon:yes stop_codon:yes gene_type:complete
MSDTPLYDEIVALEPLNDVEELADAFGVILGVPGMELQYADIDWSSMPIAQRSKAKEGMQSAIDTLKDQAMAQAEAIRNYIEKLRDNGALSGDTTKDID